MKENNMRFPGPFNESAVSRQVRMGLLRPDGSVNEASVSVLAQVLSALYFDSLCDTSADMEQVIQTCKWLVDQQRTGDARQAMLSICFQYDIVKQPLPGPIWWIVGNRALVECFTQSFLRCLAGFVWETDRSGDDHVGRDVPECES